MSETGAPKGPREAVSKTQVAKAPLVKQISSNESHSPMVEATSSMRETPSVSGVGLLHFMLCFNQLSVLDLF